MKINLPTGHSTFGLIPSSKPQIFDDKYSYTCTLVMFGTSSRFCNNSIRLGQSRSGMQLRVCPFEQEAKVSKRNLIIVAALMISKRLVSYDGQRPTQREKIQLTLFKCASTTTSCSPLLLVVYDDSSYDL